MSHQITRREYLRLSGGALLSLSFWPGRLSGEEAPATDEFTFIAVNDLHYSSAECCPWFEEVVRQMESSAPEAQFCLLGGDLADDGRPDQLGAVRDIFLALKIPSYAVIGNHDHLSDTDRTAYERHFPNQINHTFVHGGWQVIGLDSSEGTKSKETVISDATLRWLDENVPKLDARRPTIIVTHFPLGDFVVARPLNAESLVRRCLHLNVQAIFSGHYHAFTERTVDHATLTTDRCCSRVRDNHDGTPEKGWFVCTASRGEITRKFVQLRI